MLKVFFQQSLAIGNGKSSVFILYLKVTSYMFNEGEFSLSFPCKSIYALSIAIAWFCHNIKLEVNAACKQIKRTSSSL